MSTSGRWLVWTSWRAPWWSGSCESRPSKEARYLSLHSTVCSHIHSLNFPCSCSRFSSPYSQQSVCSCVCMSRVHWGHGLAKLCSLMCLFGKPNSRLETFTCLSRKKMRFIPTNLAYALTILQKETPDFPLQSFVQVFARWGRLLILPSLSSCPLPVERSLLS